MPTYMLEGQEEVLVAARPLTFSLKLDGATPAKLEFLEAGRPYARAVKYPGVDIVPVVEAPIVVRIVPADASTHFADGVTATVSITTTMTGIEVERVILSGLNLEGLRSRDIVALTQRDRRVAISALSPEEIDERELGDVGRAARVAASEALGTHRLERAQRQRFIIAVDDSASFRLRIADGTALAMVGILEGLAAVSGEDGFPELVAVGTSQRVIERPDGPLETSLKTHFESRVASTGTVDTIALQSRAGDPRQQILYITDRLPAPTASTRRERRGGGATVHAIVIGHDTMLDLLTPTQLPVSLVSTSTLKGILAAPTASAPSLREILGKLLQTDHSPAWGFDERDLP
ncbi:hypothetical protein [Pseudoclavibacter helvolus]|uniref:hypothetical protein n=1 Tax=Pseudoclavibacter helvolus TaxID=255205 RepID=UPI00373643CD